MPLERNDVDPDPPARRNVVDVSFGAERERDQDDRDDREHERVERFDDGPVVPRLRIVVAAVAIADERKRDRREDDHGDDDDHPNVGCEEVAKVIASVSDRAASRALPPDTPWPWS